jgi:transcription antitermination factor NusG
MSSFNAGWYLIYTKPRHEKKVQNQLFEKKISSFLPTRKILREWSDRKKLVEEPLFPSYIFVYLNDMSDYFAGKEADGSLYYVRSGGVVARVNDDIISSIQLLSNKAKDLEVSTDRFESGTRLLISKGPLTGLICEVVGCGTRQKLLVRVDLLQRNLLVALPEESLAKI